MLPETLAWDPKTKDPRVRWLRRQLYGLSFELVHGQVFRTAPPQTHFFIGVPDPRTNPASLGNEEAVFRDHLKNRVGWSEETINERVRFFTIPGAVPFPQDMAEPMGYDERGRLILGIGSDAEDYYRDAVDSLGAAYPEDFLIRRLPGINTEGGDLALVRLPEGTVGLLVGHNRIRRYVERLHPEVAPNAPISEAHLAQAQRAYGAAFDGVETIVVGREALLKPRLANPEIFHLDMVVAVLRGSAGVVAFVPTYRGSPVDALSNVQLPAEAVDRFQAEYDRAAAQLAARGYRVARVTFADHPVRSPVNVGKFVDPGTGRSFVLLGRYPDHLQAAPTAQARLQMAFEALDAAVVDWRQDPSDKRWGAVQAAIAAAWTQMDESVQMPNSIFDSQRRLYESNGIGVKPFPIFPTGEGGVHCLLLK